MNTRSAEYGDAEFTRQNVPWLAFGFGVLAFPFAWLAVRYEPRAGA